MKSSSVYGNSNERRTKSRIASTAVFVIFAVIAGSRPSRAQLPPVQSPPGWGQVPQGTGACSVEKSCADLAPGMIRSALGPSPIGENALALAAIWSSRADSTSENPHAAEWAASAFRRAGADVVHVEKFGDKRQFENVVAEIRGRDKPQDYVLIGAAFDGSAAGPMRAAEDAAALIDAVRVIHDTGNIPRRSIRLVLFATGAAGESGHDPDCAGVWAYVRAHRADLDRVAAAVALGAPERGFDGFSLEGRPDTLTAVQEALEPLRPLGIRNFTQQVHIPTVVTPLWLEGVPTLVATATKGEDAADHRNTANSAGLNIPSSRLRDLKRQVAIAAVATYALADAETRIGPRLSREQVEKSIASMQLLPKLRASGQLVEWESADTVASH